MEFSAMMTKSDTMRRFSQTKAGKNAKVKAIIADDKEQSTCRICSVYWFNIILNIAWIIVFSIFAFV